MHTNKYDHRAKCNLMQFLGPFYQQGLTLTLIPTWISNHIEECGMKILIHSKLEPCSRWSLEWISNFTPHFTMFLITYPCLHMDGWHPHLAPERRVKWYVYNHCIGSIEKKLSDTHTFVLMQLNPWAPTEYIPGLILGLRPTNERRRYCNDVSHWLGTSL